MPLYLHSLPILLLLLLLPSPSHQSQQCITYLKTLQTEYILNPVQFLHNMTPYLVLSGKSIDDLGFPGSCEADKRGYKYSTVQVSIQTETVTYTGYLGFCFIQACDVDDLNMFAEFIIDFIFKEYQGGVSGKFVQSPLQLEFSPLALVMCLVFLIPITISMLHPILYWISLCRQPTDSLNQPPPPSLYIDLQNPSLQYIPEQQLTQNSPILQKLSLHYKWRQLWLQQKSQKIYEFSIFRILAVPIIIYGEIFWLTNFGAYNYYAFYQEIYDQWYIKVAMFSYYMPDVFLFVSGFLFCKKVLSLGQGQKYWNILECLLGKIVRLYPLYIAVFLIFWLITPALHCGPVWYVYQQQAQVCNTAWWRVILMIDNWWAQGCYPVLWFVQVQVQSLLISCLLFYPLYFYSPKLGIVSLIILLLSSLGLMIGLQAQMLVSVQIAINSYTQLYFKSLYSHIVFYFIGIGLALLAQKQSLRIWIQNNILDKSILLYTLWTVAISITLTILFRPWTWKSSQQALSLQLSLCRIGIILCFILFCINGIFVKKSIVTSIHKYAYYMYAVLLFSYMVVLSSFWSVGSFMYVSGYDVLNQMVPNFIVSYAVGIGIGLVFDFRSLRK